MGGVFYVWKIMGKNHDVCVGIVDNYACVCHDRVFWRKEPDNKTSVDYTVVENADLPEELKKLIESKKIK